MTRSLSVYPQEQAEAADIHLDASGNLAVVSGAEDVRQRTAERLRFFLGEWHQGRRQGVPWLEEVLLRPGDLGLTANIISGAVETLEGVAEVLSLRLDYNGPERHLAAYASIRTTDGLVLNLVVPAPDV